MSPVSSKRPGGICGWGRPRRKWLGVRGPRLLGCQRKWVSGRAFNIESTSRNVVLSTSSRTVCVPNTAFSAVFAERTSLSHTPPPRNVGLKVD